MKQNTNMLKTGRKKTALSTAKLRDNPFSSAVFIPGELLRVRCEATNKDLGYRIHRIVKLRTLNMIQLVKINFKDLRVIADSN